MANVGDDVLRNILARLPGKPLLRFRCVSKHWNHLISDPYLMKTRSRRMILLPFPRPLALIDDNVPAQDKAHSMVRIGSPLDHQEEDIEVSIVGTLNGIVLLALTDFSLRCHCQLILYNPLTCALKILEVMDTPVHFIPFVFGFGYGYGDHDLKIVKFYPSIYTTTPQVYKFSDFLILALNLKDMEFSKIKLPRTVEMEVLLLGSVDGCLCLVNKIGDLNFDMWLMKEKCSWLKAHSFRFGGLEGGFRLPDSNSGKTH
ncbi:hypothetical protein QVD17_36279 [Tagetes erecta]|uniref:F-box domain-containing protein n=1 Tax=Tagetes erecta TaxID=13708 RepID=A0AAD8JY95_TARER|nr:hypothetical protein QVD17_36279 [Tagetes erecta]